MGGAGSGRRAGAPRLGHERWYALALAASAVAVAATLAFRVAASFNTVLFFLAAVVVSAAHGGRRAALLATAVCTLGVSGILFAPPYVARDVPADALRLAVFLLVALLVVAMSHALHVAREQAEAEAREAALLSEELGAQRRFLRQVLDTIPSYVFAKDRDGRFTLANQAVAAAYGTTPEALVGRSDADFNADAAQVAAFLRADRAVMDADAPLHLPEEAFTDAAGSRRWLQTVKLPLRASGESGGRADQVLGISTDITARKRAEDALRAVTEAAGDAIVSASTDGRVASWNRAAEGMFGYAAGEIVGQALIGLVPPRARAAHERALARLLAAGGSPAPGRTVELVGLRKGGQEFPLELSIGVWQAEDGARLTAVMRDLTEPRRLAAQLRQAQRMEAVGQLAGGVAHDFNNLLTVIKSFGELLLQDIPVGSPQREDVLEITAAADRAAALTRQLLAFSRRQMLRPEVLDVNAVVSGVIAMLARLIGPDVRCVTVLHPELAAVRADPGQVEQVILNLAVNARDAMPDGGCLTLATANVEIGEACAARHLGPEPLAPGPYVMLAVGDTGTGMDEATRARVFEPFFTTKPPGKGTGLGLATVYGIVRQSGGHVDVESEPGKGTTVRVYLPRHRAGVPGRALPAVPAAAALV